MRSMATLAMLLLVAACGAAPAPPASTAADPTSSVGPSPSDTAIPTALPTVTASAGPSASASQTVGPSGPTTQPTETPAPSVDFVLSSPEFADGAPIPIEFTCDGADRQPEVSWSGTPEGTVELALVMHDPDAGGFVHWVVARIPPDATSLPPSELPAGAVNGLNDFGATGYDGPCPPSGNHTYLFTLFAVSAPLEIGERPTARAVRQAAQEVTIARAELRGIYRRTR